MHSLKKIMARFFLVLALGFAVVIFLTPKIYTFKKTVQIQAGLDRVWEVLTDVSGQLSWRKDIEGVRLLRGTRLNPIEWTEKPTNGPEIAFQTVRLVPKYFWGMSFESASMQGSWEGSLNPLPDGSTEIKVKEQVKVHNSISRVVFWLTSGLDKFADDYLKGLKARAELRSPPS